MRIVSRDAIRISLIAGIIGAGTIALVVVSTTSTTESVTAGSSATEAVVDDADTASSTASPDPTTEADVTSASASDQQTTVAPVAESTTSRATVTTAASPPAPGELRWTAASGDYILQIGSTVTVITEPGGTPPSVSGSVVVAPIDSLVDTGDSRFAVTATSIGEATVTLKSSSGVVTWAFTIVDGS